MEKENQPALVPEVVEHERFGKIRVVMIESEPWFVGKDVAVALDYSNPRDALLKHVPDKFKRGSQIATPWGVQNMTLINEAGMYRLVLRSRLPAAEEFTDWTCEVLVSIRKYGKYEMPGEVKENPMMKLLDLLIENPTADLILKHETKEKTVRLNICRLLFPDY